uniref:Uncharacterized protein n=1 Tax=Oryza glumipatula TaxID=40148 RepID=A0A0E0BVK3_9ORYZ
MQFAVMEAYHQSTITTTRMSMPRRRSMSMPASSERRRWAVRRAMPQAVGPFPPINGRVCGSGARSVWRKIGP